MAQIERNRNRPTVAWWLQNHPYRDQIEFISGEYKAPCPVCGGKDRWHLRKNDALFDSRCDCTVSDMYQSCGGWQNGKSNGYAGHQEERRWKYTSIQGSTFYACRMDGPNGKSVWQEPTGVQLAPGDKWHVYHSGAWIDDADILIVEGEVAADAAKSALPKINVCTWQRATGDTDWSFCKDQTVFCWPDNDLPGFNKARRVVAELRKHKPESINIVQAGGQLKDDAADFVRRGKALQRYLDRALLLDENDRALRPVVSISDDGLMRCFRFLGFDVRYNLRSMRADIYSTKQDKLAGIEGKQWQPLTDRTADAICEHIRKKFVVVKPPRNKTESVLFSPAVFGSERWQTCLNANLARAEVDPFRKWLDDLKPVHSDRLHGWLSELFEVNEDSQDFIPWASRYLFLGAVQRTYKPGAKIDEMPVFVGEQGLGKSAIGRALLPPEYRQEGHGDALVLADDPKKFAESLQGKIIVEASEMAGLGRADLERLKSNITRQNDGSVRLAYRRNPESTPRRAVFYGTSNDHECLPNDSTGNRRFVVVQLEGDRAIGSVESYFDEYRNELWAAAKHMYLDGKRANLPRELYPAQRKSNEGYRRADIIIEDEVAQLNMLDFQEGETLRDITYEMCKQDDDRTDRRMNSRGWGNRLGKALRAQGWQKKVIRRDGKVQKLWFSP